MTHTKSLVVLAGAAVGLSSVAMAQQSADETRAAARELQSDASSRSSFAAEDGATPMEFGGYTQFQYRFNHRDDVGKDTPNTDTDDDDFAAGFRFANTKLTARGDITEEWSYKFQGGFDTDGVFTLQDMIGYYSMDNGWKFGAGQAKLPFLAEELVKDTGQLGAGRSIMNEMFSLERSQGIWVNYENEEQWRFLGAFSDGANADNTEFTSASEADYALTGRFEWMWAGEFSRFDDNTSFQGQDNAGRVGGAFHYQDGGESVNTADATLWAGTIDATIEGNGWNAQGAFVYRQVEPDQNAESITDMGIQLQGGIFVSDDWELFARVNYLLPDDDDLFPGQPGDQTREDFSTYTVGANHYLTPQSQNAKLTFQVLYTPDEQTSKDSGIQNVPTSNDSGILQDSEGGQWTATAQLQLIF